MFEFLGMLSDNFPKWGDALSNMQFDQSKTLNKQHSFTSRCYLSPSKVNTKWCLNDTWSIIILIIGIIILTYTGFTALRENLENQGKIWKICKMIMTMLSLIHTIREWFSKFSITVLTRMFELGGCAQPVFF